MSANSETSGIKIMEVRIQNFRSLQNININLEWLTVLIGENNSGKTSFLDALFMAIGAGRHSISAEDIYLALDEKKAPKERSATIDIIIRPTNGNQEVEDIFPEGSYWIGLWGEGISQDDLENDFVGIRTQLKWDSTKSEYVIQRNFLKEWKNNLNDWINSETKETVSFSQIEPISLHLLDAKRDIKDELQNRSSFWFKLVSDLDLDEKSIDKFEKILTRLNEEIISGSSVLTHVQGHLDELYKTIGGDRGSVAIAPIPRHLRDLSKGMDVSYATKDAQTFPLSRHGMGTRSLAAVLTFRAFTTWRQANSKGEKVHTMLALEEPESHLHPQAQRALFIQIEAIPGQRIISTHSPIIASQSKINQLRHFCKIGSCTKVTQIDPIFAENALKIERMVLNTRGDLLYARAIVLFEGEQTEDQALPIFGEKYWGLHPNALGITMIGVGGRDYLPFLVLAKNFQIPWYIFSDGEQDTIKSVNSALKKISESQDDNPRLIIIPDGKNFEDYISVEAYKDILIDMIITKEAQNDHHRAALEKEWQDEIDVISRIKLTLAKDKTIYGKLIAEAITNMPNEELRYPRVIRTLFEKLSQELDLKQHEG